MQGAAGDVAGFQAAGDAVRAVFGAGENEHAVHGGVFQQMRQEDGLEVGGDFIHPLGHGLGGIRPAADLDDFGRVLELGGEGLDFLGQGGGEKEGLALFRQAADDAADGRQEAHVQHAVGFVENQGFDAIEVAMALAQQVHETAGAGNNEVGAGAQGIDLGTLAHAAEDGGHGQRKVFGISPDIFLDLHREFAGGSQYEGAGAAFGIGGGSGGSHAGEQREREGGGLAGAGLGNADHVLTGQNSGNGGGLNRSGLRVAGFLHGLNDAGIESQDGKRHSLSV